MTPDRIEREITIAAPPERVWSVITEAEHVGSWFADAGAEVDLRPGGAMLLSWEGYGTPRARVEAVEPPHRLRFRLLADRLEAGIALAEKAPDRTLATLTVAGPWFTGLRRSLPRTALWRLHALCQTAATL